MENTGNMNLQELKIQGLLDRYLASRKSNESPVSAQTLHLDEDSFTAFAEGRLSEREAAPMVAHLVDCSFCRHVTTELVRLDLEFAPETESVRPMVREAEPSKISEVLSGLLSRIFGSGGQAVEAYDDKENKDEKEKIGEDPTEEK
jgi:hypothetical protein